MLTCVEDINARLAAASLKPRALWVGDDNCLRVGHSGDVITMLEDMRVSSHGPRANFPVPKDYHRR